MSDDRDKLKDLLLSEEMAQIKVLNQLINDPEQFTQKVSEVLDSASDLVINNSPEFRKKFSKIDSKTYARAIKANRQTFIDALLPIIGPMIRRSVSAAIRRFVADVNRAIELGISVKALKWRWQSFRTGVPFAEIVFNNTIEYQVQQVFLIDNHTGLLIEHAGHEAALLGDKDAMSAMLTAIQDFVKDSVSQEAEGLSAAELGDNLVWVVHGNKANIAAVIKGAPTGRLRELMTQSLEEIHIDFHWELGNQKEWNNNPNLRGELEKLLLTKSQSDQDNGHGRINFWPWLLIIAALLGWLLWSQHQKYQHERRLTQQLQQTPGFILSSLDYRNGQYHATGLQDPLADMSHINPHVVIDSTPFVSLENEMILKRLESIIQEPNIGIALEQGVLTVRGTTANQQALQERLKFVRMMPGITQLIDQTHISIDKQLQEFLASNPAPAHVVIDAGAKQVILSGVAKESEIENFASQLKNRLGLTVDNQVNSYSLEKFNKKLQSMPLLFTSVKNLNTIQQEQLNHSAEEFNVMLKLYSDIQLKLNAHSDCQGSVEESNENNQLRMSLVKQHLVSAGIPEDKVMVDSTVCRQVTDVVDLSKIGVWFEVIP